MTLTRRTRLPPRRLDVRCVLWRVPRAACRAHDRRERLSRCVLVVSGFAWIKGVVLDESLQPEMCNYYAWRKCAFKRQKSTPPVLAESTQPVLAVEQAHEVITQDLCPRPSPKTLAQDPNERACARVRAGLPARRWKMATTHATSTRATARARTHARGAPTPPSPPPRPSPPPPSPPPRGRS